MRQEYGLYELLEANAPDEPLPLLQAWFADSRPAGIELPVGMTVATVGPDVVEFEDATAQPETTYSYRVRTRGSSADSSSLSRPMCPASRVSGRSR